MASQGSLARRSAQQLLLLRDYLYLLGTKFELTDQLSQLTNLKRSPRKPEENRLKELTLMVTVLRSVLEQLDLLHGEPKVDPELNLDSEPDGEIDEENQENQKEDEVVNTESTEQVEEKPKRKRG